ncbi:copper chaperone PCu(A)C [Paracoccus salsus]|uniref:copper chaperone PCu(A)C n=1 Tax=Paracoccus salsus TaxID=2911061 RepID=UPI001F34CA26|nr:copper chaperone PCu(A)C [Paracoccus salsus]MCF3973679.1 copper chaperone PCu(A)C [Paracoccus salsus]
MKRMILAAVAALIPVAAVAQDPIAVEDAYARSANPVTGAAFMVLKNSGDTDCRLTGAASDVAERVELHTHQEVDGVMKMIHVEEGFIVAAHGEHSLARGGDHVMFLGLKAPLNDGDSVPLSLDFGDCGTVEMQVAVDNQRMPRHGMGANRMKMGGGQP